MNFEFCFQEQVAIVTGAAMGIGEGIARAFASYGATVIIADKNNQKGKEAVQRIIDEGGQGAFYEVDVRNNKDVKYMVDDVMRRFGRIDVLVNNAGINVRLPITEMEEEEWRQVLDVNLTAAWISSKAVLPAMIDQNKGKIINMTSAAAYRSLPHMAAYSASKCGIVGLTKVLAVELAVYNIQVNAVAPGYCITPMTERVRNMPQLYEYLVSNTPQHRFGEIDEIVGPVLFLASDMAGFMTGAVINADGGSTC